MSPSVFNGLLLNEIKESVKSYQVNTNYIFSSNSFNKESPALQNSKSFVVKSSAIHDQPIQPISETSVPSARNNKPEAFGKYKNSGLTESAAEELKLMLEAFMSKSKYFKESNVSLEELSNKLNTTRHNLSQVINEKYNMHFFDYINHLRVNEAVFIMLNDKANKFQISEIAYTVGYNNKTTFNNSFKKFLGKSPSAYRAELKEIRQ
ncbi:MAG: helix-turn-helix transcriptional regulator [Sphingobacteriaceae bacterium]|nr:helix-turn-helix transcriptional regulator [Sphingobacteriaceae bacterium]